MVWRPKQGPQEKQMSGEKEEKRFNQGESKTFIIVSNMFCSQVEIPDMTCIITIIIVIIIIITIIMHHLPLW